MFKFYIKLLHLKRDISRRKSSYTGKKTFPEKST